MLKVEKKQNAQIDFSPSWIWDEVPNEGKWKMRMIESLPCQNLKIIWWNLKASTLSVNKRFDQQSLVQNSPLESNISSLLFRPFAPEILILGEFSPKKISASLMNLLTSTYKFSDYRPMNSKCSDLGIAIFSKFPMTLHKVEKLKAGHFSDYQGKEYKSFERVLGHYQFLYKNKQFNLFPLHLANPWVQLERNMLKKNHFKLLSKALVGCSVLFSKNNPLSYQVDHLLDYINLEASSDSNTLLIGDFNIPKSISMPNPITYRKITKNFKDLFPIGEYTFPSKSSPDQDYPKMQIDHAFFSGLLERNLALTLPLKGSDHYPIYICLK